MMPTILLIGAVAIISSIFGEFGWRKTERTLDGACIAFALIWIAATGGPQPCRDDLDPLAPWERPATRHAIDWKAR